MYVCVCHSVTDSDIEQAVSNGVRDLAELSAKTGCSTGCGCCAEFAIDVLLDAQRRQGQFLRLVHTA